MSRCLLAIEGRTMGKEYIKIITLCIWVVSYSISSCSLPQKHSSANQHTKSISPFLVYYGGGAPFKESDYETLAKFDLLVLDRFRYKEKMNTWNEIKKRNRQIKILLYQLGPEVSSIHDDYSAYYLNNIGRYNTSRSHPMGDVNNNNAHFFLLDSDKKRVTVDGYPNNFLLDFGNANFISYWLKSTFDDVINQPWVADGIMIDNALTYHIHPLKQLFYSQPEKYKSDIQWDKAMNKYIVAVTHKLHMQGQQVIVNRGNSRHSKPLNAWMALDNASFTPDYVMEEGAFAVSWGVGAVQFFPAEQWKRQVELPSKISNSSVALLSHTDLNIGESGFDSNARPVVFEQILHYCLASYLLAKREDGPNTLFSFDLARSNGTYKTLTWLEIYQSLNLGGPKGKYRKLASVNGHVYFREFDGGYVYVNSDLKNYNDIPMPKNTLILELRLKLPWITQEATHFDIKSNSAVFLTKKTS